MDSLSNDQKKQKLLHLVDQGVSVVAAARAAGIPRATANRIVNAMPFSGGYPQAPPKTPEIEWTNDQAPPPPTPYEFKRGYHDHTYRAFTQPVAFDGFTLERVRAAISLHRQGIFIESSLLAYALLSFGPVLAATEQRIAPSLSLPRKIKAGTRGLSRVLGEEIEEQLAPRDGLIPSPYFPPTLFGTILFDLAFMGFAVLQGVDGEPDPETDIRPRYTRLWPSWSVRYFPYKKTFIAVTTEGNVEIKNDGKFTLIADSDMPHLFGAIVALGEEALDGKFTQRARASYIDRYGNPKLFATMPPGVAVRSQEGDAFMSALGTLRGPDGFGAIPNGATLEWTGLTAGQSTTFKDALDSNWSFVAAILLGSDGTLSKGTGGVYTAPTYAGVARRLVDKDLKAEVRGINVGHVAPYLSGNYAQSIAAAKGWESPVLEIPLPDPDADARIKSYSDRLEAFHEIIAEERSNGFEITQERVDQLAGELNISPPTLAAVSLAPEDRAKVVKVKEARAAQGLEPAGDDRDDLFLSELDAPAKTTEEVEHVADPAATPSPDDTAASPEPAAEPAPPPTPEEPENAGNG